MNRPLIFGAALSALSHDPNPAARKICAVAAGAPKRMAFARAVVANLKNPRGILNALAKLKLKAGTQGAKNLERLAKALSNKPPTRAELNAARMNAIYRKPSL